MSDEQDKEAGKPTVTPFMVVGIFVGYLLSSNKHAATSPIALSGTYCVQLNMKNGDVSSTYSVWICGYVLLCHWFWLSLQSAAFQTTDTNHTCTNPINPIQCN